MICSICSRVHMIRIGIMRSRWRWPSFTHVPLPGVRTVKPPLIASTFLSHTLWKRVLNGVPSFRTVGTKISQNSLPSIPYWMTFSGKGSYLFSSENRKIRVSFDAKLSLQIFVVREILGIDSHGAHFVEHPDARLPL